VAERQQGRPGTDVARPTPKLARELIETYRGQFTAVVPRHIDAGAFIELAVAGVKADVKLLEAAAANPQSLILALRECAAKGHLPMKGTFSLVPFNDSKAPGGKSIVGMEEWRGVVERMFRGGSVKGVYVETGRDNDPVLRFNRTRMVLPEHEYDEFASPVERGPLKAVYAWARLDNGGLSQVVWMNRHEIMRHRSMSRSTSAAGGGNFWGPADGEGPNTEAMWRKTALHSLEGFVPMSAEYRFQVAASEAAAGGWPGVPDRPVTTAYTEPDVVDAQLVEPGDGGDWPTVAQPAGTK
jgi:recombination protein RecT